MRPAQLSRQRRDNLGIREGVRELHHSPEVLLGESSSVRFDQLSRPRSDNPLSVFRPLTLQYFFVDPLPDLPVENRQAGVDRNGHSRARLFDHPADVGQQGSLGD